MMDAASLVRAARKSRGLSQAELATRARVHQSRVSRSERDRESPGFDTVARLLAGAGHRLYSAPTQRDDAATIATAIRVALRAGNRQRAVRELIQLNDNLVAERGLVRGVLGLAEPATVGDRAWDAAIAALVAWRLSEEGLPLPAWVDDADRFLADPRGLDIDPADPVPPPDEVPPAFAERGVLAWRDTFESV